MSSLPDDGKILVYVKLNSQGRTIIDNLPTEIYQTPGDFEIKIIEFFIENPPRYPIKSSNIYHIFCEALQEQSFFGGYRPILFSLLLNSVEPPYYNPLIDFPSIPLKKDKINSLEFTIEPSLPNLQIICIFLIQRRER